MPGEDLHLSDQTQQQTYCHCRPPTVGTGYTSTTTHEPQAVL